jgi:hypothetical protein
MIKQLRWLFPGGCFSLGLYLLRYSYHAYSDWQVYLELGDHSGAELPEIEFKWSATIALERWLGLSEQLSRIAKWSPCRVYAATGRGSWLK